MGNSLVGGNYAENQIRNAVNASISIMMDSSANCITTVSGANIISIVGGRNINLKDIRQKVWVKVNTTCVTSQTNKSSVQQSVDAQFKQAASAISEAFSLGDTKAKNVTESVMNLSTQVISRATALFQSIASSTNTISIVGVDGMTMEVVDQEVMLNEVASATMDQLMDTTSGQTIKLIVDQTAKATTMNFTAIVAIIVIGVVASVFIAFGSRYFLNIQSSVSATLRSSGFWAAFLAIPTLFCLITVVLSMTPYKVMWPLKQIESTDTEAEQKKKKTNNIAAMIICSIVGTASIAAMAIVGVIEFNKPKATYRPMVRASVSSGASARPMMRAAPGSGVRRSLAQQF